MADEDVGGIKVGLTADMKQLQSALDEADRLISGKAQALRDRQITMNVYAKVDNATFGKIERDLNTVVKRAQERNAFKFRPHFEVTRGSVQQFNRDMIKQARAQGGFKIPVIPEFDPKLIAEALKGQAIPVAVVGEWQGWAADRMPEDHVLVKGIWDGWEGEGPPTFVVNGGPGPSGPSSRGRRGSSNVTRPPEPSSQVQPEAEATGKAVAEKIKETPVKTERAPREKAAEKAETTTAPKAPKAAPVKTAPATPVREMQHASVEDLIAANPNIKESILRSSWEARLAEGWVPKGATPKPVAAKAPATKAASNWAEAHRGTTIAHRTANAVMADAVARGHATDYDDARRQLEAAGATVKGGTRSKKAATGSVADEAVAELRAAVESATPADLDWDEPEPTTAKEAAKSAREAAKAIADQAKEAAADAGRIARARVSNITQTMERRREMPSATPLPETTDDQAVCPYCRQVFSKRGLPSHIRSKHASDVQGLTPQGYRKEELIRASMGSGINKATPESELLRRMFEERRGIGQYELSRDEERIFGTVKERFGRPVIDRFTGDYEREGGLLEKGLDIEALNMGLFQPLEGLSEEKTKALTEDPDFIALQREYNEAIEARRESLKAEMAEELERVRHNPNRPDTRLRLLRESIEDPTAGFAGEVARRRARATRREEMGVDPDALTGFRLSDVINATAAGGPGEAPEGWLEGIKAYVIGEAKGRKFDKAEIAELDKALLAYKTPEGKWDFGPDMEMLRERLDEALTIPGPEDVQGWLKHAKKRGAKPARIKALKASIAATPEGERGDLYADIIAELRAEYGGPDPKKLEEIERLVFGPRQGEDISGLEPGDPLRTGILPRIRRAVIRSASNPEAARLRMGALFNPNKRLRNIKPRELEMLEAAGIGAQARAELDVIDTGRDQAQSTAQAQATRKANIETGVTSAAKPTRTVTRQAPQGSEIEKRIERLKAQIAEYDEQIKDITESLDVARERGAPAEEIAALVADLKSVKSERRGRSGVLDTQKRLLRATPIAASPPEEVPPETMSEAEAVRRGLMDPDEAILPYAEMEAELPRREPTREEMLAEAASDTSPEANDDPEAAMRAADKRRRRRERDRARRAAVAATPSPEVAATPEPKTPYAQHLEAGRERFGEGDLWKLGLKLENARLFIDRKEPKAENALHSLEMGPGAPIKPSERFTADIDAISEQIRQGKIPEAVEAIRNLELEIVDHQKRLDAVSPVAATPRGPLIPQASGGGVEGFGVDPPKQFVGCRTCNIRVPRDEFAAHESSAEHRANLAAQKGAGRSGSIGRARAEAISIAEDTPDVTVAGTSAANPPSTRWCQVCARPISNQMWGRHIAGRTHQANMRRTNQRTREVLESEGLPVPPDLEDINRRQVEEAVQAPPPALAMASLGLEGLSPGEKRDLQMIASTASGRRQLREQGWDVDEITGAKSAREAAAAQVEVEDEPRKASVRQSEIRDLIGSEEVDRIRQQVGDNTQDLLNSSNDIKDEGNKILKENPVRALSVAVGQVLVQTIGGRSKLESQIKDFNRAVTREQQLIRRAGAMRSSVEEAQAAFTEAQVAGDEEMTTRLGEEIERRKNILERAEKAVVRQQEEEVGPQAERLQAGRRRFALATLGVGTVGIVAGTALFTTAMSAFSAATAQGAEWLARVTDEMTGFATQTNALAKQLGEGALQTGRIQGGIRERLGMSGIGGQQADALVAAISPRITGEVAAQRAEMMRDTMMLGIQGLRDRAAQPDIQNFRGVFQPTGGMVLPLFGQTNIGAQASVQEQLARMTGSMPSNTLFDFMNGEAFGLQEMLAPIRDVFTDGRASRDVNAQRESAAFVMEGLTDAIGRGGGDARFINPSTQADGRDLMAEQAQATLLERMGGSPDLANRIRSGDVALVDANGEVITSQRELAAAFDDLALGLQTVDIEQLLKAGARQLESTFYGISQNLRNAMQTWNPIGTAMQLAQNPRTPFGMGVSLANATPGIAGAALGNRMQIGSAIDARAAQGRNEMVSMAAQFGGSAGVSPRQLMRTFDEINRYGDMIVGWQTQIAEMQLGQQMAEYNRQVFVAERNISDLQGLVNGVGDAHAGNIGILQRENLMRQRRIQDIQREGEAEQLALNQRQINFQRAVAGFTASGATPAEAAAQLRQAQLEADFAQRQQDRQEDIFDISGDTIEAERKIVDEQNLRALQDALAEFQLFQDRFTLDQDTKLIADNIALAQQYQATLAQDMQSMLGALQWDPLESTCRHASLSIL